MQFHHLSEMINLSRGIGQTHYIFYYIISCCFYYISFPTAIVAVVFAYLSIKKQAAAGANRGMAIAGMVCGIVALIPAMIVLLCGASLLDEI